MSKESVVCMEAPTPVKSRRKSPPIHSVHDASRPTAVSSTTGSVAEEEMVRQNLHLVRSVVSRLGASLPTHVDPDELYSSGLTGLLNAVRNYDPTAGTSFETYARVRIRGAILDELRRMDWVPRSIHTKAKKIEEAQRGIEQREGRPAREDEVAAALDLSLKDYRRWMEQTRPPTFMNLDADLQSDSDDDLSQHESLADGRTESPTERAFRHELADLVRSQLDRLPEMQRKVLALYYFEELRLSEIAATFDLTESRICQIHSQALQTIRTCLQECDPCFLQPFSL